MKTMTEIRLGQDGIEYVRSCLRQGSDLCEKLLELTFDDGEALAALPDDVSLKRATRFDIGGLLSRKEMLDWLTSHLKNLFDRNNAGTFVLHDIWAKAGDIESTIGKRMLFHNENVYYFLSGEDLKAHALAETLRQLRSYRTIGVFTRFQLAPHQIAPGDQASNGLIIDIAEATREIFVSAYDQEGFVVWRKLP